LLIAYWVLVGAAFIAAVVAVERARRTSKRLERLREAYWDLRYELGQLQARLNRLEAERTDQPPEARPAAANNFVPLSSLKR
jgi:uncharacterized protein YlxW (UPF0749 family)